MVFVVFGIILLDLAVSATNVAQCNWVLTDYHGVQATDVCLAGGWKGEMDTMYACTDGDTVRYNLYGLNSGCTTTSYLASYATIDNITRFDCSKTTCTDYAIYSWYSDPNDCAQYTKETIIPNVCLSFKSNGGGEYVSYQVYDDASQNPTFNIQTINYNDAACTFVDRCFTMSDVPSSNQACGQPPVLSYTSTPDTERLNCDNPGNAPILNGSYAISSDMNHINCNWVYYNEWVRVIGICDIMSTDPDMQYDSQIVCDGTSSVSQFYYDSSDGSCSGNIVHQQLMTDNPTLFDCSMGICGQNDYIKFRRYDDCNTSIAGFGTYNMITNHCFRDIEDATDYFVTCDSNLNGFRYGYDIGDPKCSALNPDTPHYTDLNNECEISNYGEASYEVLVCYGSKSPTNVPSGSPTHIPSTSPTNIPTASPSNNPSNNPTASPITTTIVVNNKTPVGAANSIFDCIFSTITFVVICGMIN